MKSYLTRKEMYAAWSDLLDIPEREDRDRTEVEELELDDLTNALFPTTVDNSRRIAALFTELDECTNFQRILEIDEALRGYGVEAVTPEENRELERYAEMRTGYRTI